VNMRISRSNFIAGAQCPKRLYWQVHEPELAAERHTASEALIEQGGEVGLLARQMFPGGVEVRSEGFDHEIRATRELTANREVPQSSKAHSSTAACSCASIFWIDAGTVDGVSLRPEEDMATIQAEILDSFYAKLTPPNQLN
jgi:hypothetical protein